MAGLVPDVALRLVLPHPFLLKAVELRVEGHLYQRKRECIEKRRVDLLPKGLDMCCLCRQSVVGHLARE